VICYFTAIDFSANDCLNPTSTTSCYTTATAATTARNNHNSHHHNLTTTTSSKCLPAFPNMSSLHCMHCSTQPSSSYHDSYQEQWQGEQ